MTKKKNTTTTNAAPKAATTKAPTAASVLKVMKAKAPTIDIGTITIRDDVPIPQVSTTRSKYPFEDLQYGQSFFVPCAAKDAGKVRANLLGAARRAANATGAKFIVVIDAERGGVGAWRVDKPRAAEQEQAEKPKKTKKEAPPDAPTQMELPMPPPECEAPPPDEAPSPSEPSPVAGWGINLK
jgi:hypothetical protein